nr:MAG TPA: hypothetical protein [Caudoviricetes sp.]
MDYTKNLKLSKPSYDDDVDIQIINTNMDVLDDNISKLDYVKNVQTDNNGLTFTKKDNTQIAVPLDYLKLTGGTVTGDTEFTGKLTNNSKDVGRLFCNKLPILTPLIDFDKMAEVRGVTTKTTVSTIRNEKTESVTYYDWCLFSAPMGIVYFETGDIYLKEPFTNYDKLLVVTLGSNNNQSMRCNVIDCGMLEWYMNNIPIVPLTGATGRGSGWWGLFPYKKWGTQTKTSTTTKLTCQGESTDMVEIYGVKYVRD